MEIMIPTRNARIVTSYSALFTVTFGVLAADLYQRSTLPDLEIRRPARTASARTAPRLMAATFPSGYPLTAIAGR